ncbi:addiction module protein [Longimicrobium terrae]|uniref:Putative addiction module component (TIGR02574 family) n=1 Tax=Longimicrobium terrae TaxID=1639882 RepID=A0A841H535_9BACT|nr:addiction module protein [Longimicrobium terrae]MBB4638639.1 putative addiction module component (TIGR02574 family) [Longimicrobium terrae]MBB6072879.1 putative addiction module component (TIGR02574 family) [Longimicrobium terrae]NNC31494.1 addiction module protein [Longimicrobium terrae]
MSVVAESLDAEALESAVLQLPISERARLAARLLSSLDEDAVREEAWDREIAERMRAYEAGEMRTFSPEEVFKRSAELLR